MDMRNNKEDTSSSRSWGSVGHVSTLQGVHESGDGVHSQDRDRQVTRAGHARPLRHAGVCTCTEGQFENKQLENGQTLAEHLCIDVAFFCALYSRVMYRCNALIKTCLSITSLCHVFKLVI